MATDYNFAIYDTAVLGTTAKTVHTMFQVAVSQSATADRFYTNMRGNGIFPNQENFLIKKLFVFPDANFNEDDRENYFLNSYLSIIYKDQLVLSVPSRLAVGRASYGGHFTQGTAADEALIGLEGDGYMLELPLLIEGGNSFKVEYGQGVAMSAGSQNIKVVLDGRLTLGK